LFPWGATWVSADQLASLQTQEQSIQAQADALIAQANGLVSAIQLDQSQMVQDQQTMTEFQPRLYGRSGTYGATMATPTQYTDAQNDYQRLSNVVVADRNEISRLRARYDQLEQTYSVPQYTGVQNLFGPDGTPLLRPAARPAAP